MGCHSTQNCVLEIDTQLVYEFMNQEEKGVGWALLLHPKWSPRTLGQC